MNWAKLTLYAMYFTALGVSISQHGKPKEGNISAYSALIGTAIGGFLLYFA